MEYKGALQPGDFADMVAIFESRIAQRDIIDNPNVPQSDADIVRLAGHIGLSDQEILDATLLARRRISSHVGIELVNLDTHAIAQLKSRKINLN